MNRYPFAVGEYYHIYNHGVDKRDIFSDQYDIGRFFQSMQMFNTIEPIGSIYEISFQKKPDSIKLGGLTPKLVEFVAYCLNPNHLHFILKEITEGGISEFMKRLGGGYTCYFNEKNNRSGSLFQGTYKSKHVNSNEYLLHLSAYINLNYKAHGIEENFRSSWQEYINNFQDGFCNKDIILGQFASLDDYKKFAESSLIDIQERKKAEKELAMLMFE